MRKIELWVKHLNAEQFEQANEVAPECGFGHAVGPTLFDLTFHNNVCFEPQGRFDLASRGIPYVFRFKNRWGMLYEVRGEGGVHQSLAWSEDLFNWQPAPNNPAFSSPSWGPEKGPVEDTCIIERPDGTYLIYFKSRKADGYVSVGLNLTKDFKTFEEFGPVLYATPGLRGTIGLESPCVICRDSMWHLFYTLGTGIWHAVSDRPTDFIQGTSYWIVGTGAYLLGHFHATEVFRSDNKWYLSTTRKEQSRLENRQKGQLCYRGTYEDEQVLEEGIYLSEICWDGDLPILKKPAKDDN
jgi:hypothetical protein